MAIRLYQTETNYDDCFVLVRKQSTIWQEGEKYMFHHATGELYDARYLVSIEPFNINNIPNHLSWHHKNCDKFTYKRILERYYTEDQTLYYLIFSNYKYDYNARNQEIFA